MGQLSQNQQRKIDVVNWDQHAQGMCIRATHNTHANVTANTPEVSINGIENNDGQIAEKITQMSKFNDKRNNFSATWKKLVLDYLTTGPAIVEVNWDSEWMGGNGPNRWIGDIRVNRVDKKEFYPDPAIINLEENIQDCSFIIRRIRKKISYIKQRWDKGKLS